MTSRFLFDQGFSEANTKPDSIVWACLSESITGGELLSTAFNPNSLVMVKVCWFLLKALSDKSIWKRLFNELQMEKKRRPVKVVGAGTYNCGRA